MGTHITENKNQVASRSWSNLCSSLNAVLQSLRRPKRGIALNFQRHEGLSPLGLCCLQRQSPQAVHAKYPNHPLAGIVSCYSEQVLWPKDSTQVKKPGGFPI
jgi:hypothetical protein